jgi:hypothetical protein
MTKQWIQDNFTIIDNQVVVFETENESLVCDLDWLATTITNSNTYTDLSSLAIANQGWQKIFDQWNEKGLI